MKFYPLLFENETKLSMDNIPEGEYKKILKKYLGGKIILDPTTDEIIYVDDKSYRTPINNWEQILDLHSSKQKFLIEFLQDIFNEKDIELNVSEIINNKKENIKKEKEKERGKAKTWVPYEIPEFPRLGIKYKDFWEYQLEKYKDNIEEEKEKIIKRETKKINIKDDEKRELTLKIPSSLNIFFKENGKEKEWKSFISNIEKSGLSTIGFINNLFTYMAAVVEEKTTPGMVYRPTSMKLKLNTPEEEDKWKEDMLEYIGKYTTKTIPEINDNVYKNEVLNKGTFLSTLFITEPKGVGRGEVLMAYILQNAKFAGGAEAYDVTANGLTYELKDYSDAAGSSIRLGTHGKVTRFGWWDSIISTIKLTRKIRNNIGDKKLKVILGNYFFRVWDLVSTRDSYLKRPKSVGSAIEAGELNMSRLETLKLFYMLSHELILKGTWDEEKEEYLYKINVEDDFINKDDLKQIKEIKEIEYVNDPLKLIKDLNTIGKEYNDEALNVDYFMVFLKHKMVIDKPEKFVFSTISQAAVKIKHVDSKKQTKTTADKAFEKWEQSKTQPFIRIYRQMLGSIYESFYLTLD